MPTETYVTDSEGRSVITKDPASVLDYTFNWSVYLAAIADSIAGVVFTITGSATMAVDSSSFTSTTATAWLSGGLQADGLIQVDCTITTASTPARVDSRSIYINIRDK